MAKKSLDPTLARKERDILWAAFRKAGGQEPSLWARENHSIISVTAWCSILNQAAPASTETLLMMCAELKVPSQAIREMLCARGEGGRKIASLLKGG